jgi:hypothetical protein
MAKQKKTHLQRIIVWQLERLLYCRFGDVHLNDVVLRDVFKRRLSLKKVDERTGQVASHVNLQKLGLLLGNRPAKKGLVIVCLYTLIKFFFLLANLEII